MNTKTKNKETILYNTLYLVKPTILEENVLQMVDKYKMLLEKHSTYVVVEYKGKRHLNYDIAGHSDNFFVDMHFTGNGNLVNLLQKYLRLDENVTRYQTVQVEADEILVSKNSDYA